MHISKVCGGWAYTLSSQAPTHVEDELGCDNKIDIIKAEAVSLGWPESYREGQAKNK